MSESQSQVLMTSGGEDQDSTVPPLKNILKGEQNVVQKRKHLSEEKSPECEIVKKVKNPRPQHLILTTVYELNNSASKKLFVGLEIQPDGYFEPVIRLLGNCSRGLSLNLSEWTQLVNKFDVIASFFEDGCTGASPIVLGRYHLVFTTSYSAKAVLLEKIIEDDDCRGPTGEPKGKKVKYSPGVVMQMPTFEGLASVVVCVDERVRRLERIVKNVEHCKNILLEELCSYFKSENMKNPSEEFVKHLVKAKYDFLKEQVKNKLPTSFVELYLDIVLLELTVVLHGFIASEVKEDSVCKKSKKNV